MNIKRFTVGLTATLLGLISLSVLATEYQVKSQYLLTFSGSHTQIKLCDQCEAISFVVTPETKFFDKNNEIDLAAATELYLKKNYSRVSLHTLGERKELLFMTFGLPLEGPRPPSATSDNQENAQ